MSCSFSQSCTSGPLECDLWLLSIQWRYPSSNSGSLVCTVARDSLDSLSTQTKAYLKSSLTGWAGDQYDQSANPSPVGNSSGQPRPFQQLPCALFRTYRTYCYCINQVTVIQEQSRFLGKTPSHPGTVVVTLSINSVCYIFWRVRC